MYDGNSWEVILKEDCSLLEPPVVDQRMLEQSCFLYIFVYLSTSEASKFQSKRVKSTFSSFTVTQAKVCVCSVVSVSSKIDRTVDH